MFHWIDSSPCPYPSNAISGSPVQWASARTYLPGPVLPSLHIQHAHDVTRLLQTVPLNITLNGRINCLHVLHHTSHFECWLITGHPTRTVSAHMKHTFLSCCQSYISSSFGSANAPFLFLWVKKYQKAWDIYPNALQNMSKLYIRGTTCKIWTSVGRPLSALCFWEVQCPYETCCLQCLKGEEAKVCLFAAAVKNIAEHYGNLHEREPPM